MCSVYFRIEKMIPLQRACKMLSNDTKFFFFFVWGYTNYGIGGHRRFLPFSVDPCVRFPSNKHSTGVFGCSFYSRTNRIRSRSTTCLYALPVDVNLLSEHSRNDTTQIAHNQFFKCLSTVF